MARGIEKDYEVVYDNVYDGIRTVKLNVRGIPVCLLHNTRSGDTGFTFERTGFLDPRLQYVGGRFVMTYDYVVVTPELQDEFKKAYDGVLEFCRAAGPVLERVAGIVGKGGTL